MIIHKKPLFRTGLGQDSHQLIQAQKNQTLTLAGVNFACGLTFAANSDGDVILHALCNALSTAVGGGSFSTVADQLYQEKNITDSSIYLSHFLNLIAQKGYHLVNLSVSIEAYQPKLEKHRPALVASLAKLTQLPSDCLGLSFTSGEGLTEFGRGQGISAFVSVLLEAN